MSRPVWWTPEREHVALVGIRAGIQVPARQDVHSGDPDAFGIIPASSRRDGPKDMWAVTYRGQTLCRWDRFEDAQGDMLDRHRRAVREAENGPVGGSLGRRERGAVGGRAAGPDGEVPQRLDTTMTRHRITTRRPTWLDRVWYRRLGLPVPLGVSKHGGRVARLVPYRLRHFHRAYANAFGYFWLPCPLCDRPFGGHESGGSVPDPTRDEFSSLCICSECTRQRTGGVR